MQATLTFIDYNLKVFTYVFIVVSLYKKTKQNNNSLVSLIKKLLEPLSKTGPVFASFDAENQNRPLPFKLLLSFSFPSPSACGMFLGSDVFALPFITGIKCYLSYQEVSGDVFYAFMTGKCFQEMWPTF